VASKNKRIKRLHVHLRAGTDVEEDGPRQLRGTAALKQGGWETLNTTAKMEE